MPWKSFGGLKHFFLIFVGAIYDPSAFVFSVQNHLNIPAHKWNRTVVTSSVVDNPTYGPWFGQYGDFQIGDRPLSSFNTYASQSQSYTSTPFAALPHPSTILIGTSSAVTLSDIEVFSVQSTENVHISSGSTVLNSTHLASIYAWTNTSNWYLCYKYVKLLSALTMFDRSSLHGLTGAAFHSRCDNKGSTVVVFRYNSYIFGAYTSLPWTSSNTWKSDPYFFIYSLVNPYGYSPFTMGTISSYSIYSMNDLPTSLPSFYDVTAAGTTYSFQSTSLNYPEGRYSALTGALQFTLADVEVYVLDPIPTKTILLNETEKSLVSTWVGQNVDNLQVCYRMTHHGGVSSVFHKKCDGKGPTLTVIKAQSGLFGGYTSLHWNESANAVQSDPTAFIFSLRNPRNHIYKISVQQGSQHVRNTASTGPSFGSTDILVSDNVETTLQASTLATFTDPLITNANLVFANVTPININELEVYSTTWSASPMINTTSIANSSLYFEAILGWTKISASSWYLCYRGSSNSFNTATFHTMCNLKGAMLAIYRSTPGNYLFGGFVNASLTSRNAYFNDPDAFLFSLHGPYSAVPIKAWLRSAASSVYDHVSNLPSWNSLMVSGTSITPTLGTSMEFAAFDPRTLLGGSNQFYIDDIEVLYLPGAEAPIISNYLTPTFLNSLKNWTNNGTLTACYKASLFGFSAAQLYERCAERGALVYLVNSLSNHLFGAYVSRYTYNARNVWFADANAFLFTLTNSRNSAAEKLPVRTTSLDNTQLQDITETIRLGQANEFIMPNNPRTSASTAYVTPLFTGTFSLAMICFGSTGTTPLLDVVVYSTVKIGAWLNESSVINSTTQALLQQWTATNDWSVCYNSSLHGLNAATFHTNCNNKGATITMFRSVSGYVFGGYTSLSWLSRGGYATDATAFLYLLVSPYAATPVRSTFASSSAIYDVASYYPTFGTGHDIFLSGTALNCGGMGYAYNFPMLNSNNYFTGALQYYTNDLEVYYVADNNPPPMATLLSASQRQLVEQWIGLSNYNWQLCWKGTYHGFSSYTFHSNCDYKGPTVTVVNTTLGYKFGGYTSQSWIKNAGWQFDSSAFLFSLNNTYNTLLRFTTLTSNVNTIQSQTNAGPRFGSDIAIADQSNVAASTTTLGNAFSNGGYPSSVLIGGASNFLVQDIEVYTLGISACSASCFSLPATSSSVCSGKGFCNPPDNCTCLAGFTGNNCQYATCFNITGDSPIVCNNRNGSCTNTDTCTCLQGYSGSQCQTPICNSMLATNPNVCTSRGHCTSANSCTCNATFSGQFCQFQTCYNVSSGDAAVCSSHGVCNSFNNCSCTNGYFGLQCESWLCFGQYNNASACFGHGACAATDSCTCQNGFTGVQCQTPICFGVLGSSAQVCQSRGSCTSPDICSCNAGYGGARCELSSCFGILSNSSTVCNARGTCIGADLCSCIGEFSGLQCEHTLCHGISSANLSACSGRGACLSYNNCSCFADWTGDSCQIPVCFSINATDPRVCNNGNGTCFSANHCTCATNYTGNECQTPICHGIPANISRVCNYLNGTCIRNNTCSCRTGYVGTSCEYPICFSLNSTDARVCSAHGACLSIDNCHCDLGYSGANCDNHVTCNGLSQVDPRTCSGRGACLGNDNCTCLQGYSGNTCQYTMCNNIASFNSSVCNGTGICRGPSYSQFYHLPYNYASPFGVSFGNPLILGARDFDIDAMIFKTSATSTIVWSYDRSAESVAQFRLESAANGSLAFYSTNAIPSDGHTVASAAGTIALNTWYNIRISRRALIVSMYINSTLVASGFSSTVYDIASFVANRPHFLIGSRYQSGSGTLTEMHFVGFISQVHIVSDAIRTAPICICSVNALGICDPLCSGICISH